ncbi:ABC transporter ATP-binding protein [Spiribacter vilamensis]|uniref:ABC-type bacteriocin/lantibiotic exporter with double-glycine peptidase domain n=1 Tax=Spiribacter vilamensis TaxID=531306 RepID=A0A4Q8D1A0_9GAMM|nr:ABC transporter ATP-binding protein [Spiribacter vilamensis]RZU99093.1 ABC-type bacteriocin/lantibiotic exporter with double-glycine peptidase domain [Spiribacter vilamensis]TVO61910.1 ABC transporter ATP-binding protein [Spiribacter vilamensis]
MTTLQKALAVLTASERRRGVLLLLMVTTMAAAEMVGVASVMPFLGVLGQPGVIESNAVLNWAYTTFGFASIDAFVMFLGAGAFGLILASAVYRTFVHYWMNRFIEMRRHSIGERLLETYLRQPYAFFLNRHSGDMAKNVLSEVDQFIGNFLRPGVMLVANAALAIGIVGLLVAVNPLLALLVSLLFAGIYSVIYLTVRRRLVRLGRERVRANQARFTTAGECLGGIKDVKLLGREHAYVARYRGPSTVFAGNMATTQTLSQVPKFLVESVAVGGIMLLSLVMIAIGGGVRSEAFGELLPVLGLYAFGALRLLPAAQAIYQGIAQTRAGTATLDAIHADLCEREHLAPMAARAPTPLHPEQEIGFEAVTYRYPNAPADALQGINLALPVGSALGVVGTTGAGKTTLVDVLLGLLRPTNGAITVDGEPVTDDNLRAWQRALGYVPQDIFLTDATVTENIAFGIEPGQIDTEQVERCARMAQVHDFVVNEMPEGYDTIVGERGVRLSGGQRQRIGIARALYHNPDILVFDEATSALDNVTERAVMQAIDALHHQKTIILIAHRLSTVERCDQVVLLDHGHVEACGTFEELKAGSERFRRMASGV